MLSERPVRQHNKIEIDKRKIFALKTMLERLQNDLFEKPDATLLSLAILLSKKLSRSLLFSSFGLTRIYSSVFLSIFKHLMFHDLIDSIKVHSDVRALHTLRKASEMYIRQAGHFQTGQKCVAYFKTAQRNIPVK